MTSAIINNEFSVSHSWPGHVSSLNPRLAMIVLWKLLMHVVSFILERKMHFIVANIVRPDLQQTGFSS